MLVLSGQDTVKVFRSFGWEVRRQRGSHIIMSKTGHAAILSIPNHKELRPGTLRHLIDAAGLTVEEFASHV